MTKKYYGLQVHTLTFLKVDENGESIDGKQYEYTGDHSGFCDGIEDEYLEEIKKWLEELRTRQYLFTTGAGSRPTATSGKLQAASVRRQAWQGSNIGV